MKIFKILILSLFCTLVYSQVEATDSTKLTYENYMVKDSISGGSFAMELEPEIAKLLESQEKDTCPKPTRYVVPKRKKENRVPVTSSGGPCASQPRVLGYKIQIAYSKNRAEAYRIRDSFRRQYPSLSAEVAYRQPDYRVLVGDYFTKRSAGQNLSSIKKKYKAAFLVQWRVFCRRAR